MIDSGTNVVEPVVNTVSGVGGGLTDILKDPLGSLGLDLNTVLLYAGGAILLFIVVKKIIDKSFWFIIINIIFN